MLRLNRVDSLQCRTQREGVRGLGVALALVAWGLGAVVPAQAWGGKVELKRRFRPGQKMVYATKLHTLAQIQSDPPGLKDLLPPVPTEFNVEQQNTVTVQRVSADGTAEVQNRFDQFDIQSDLAERVSGNVQDSAQEVQDELSRKVAGHALTARYDPRGRLLGFEGAEEMLGGLEPAMREPIRQALRLLLEHMGGNTLYPDHKVKRGEEWKQKLDAEPSENYPFKVQGESTMHYAGKTRYRGVKAAIVDFQFKNLMTPSLEQMRQTGPIGMLEARGLGLEIRIEGQGQGRALLALNDGRVLQTHSTIHQTLSVRLTGATPLPLPTSQPVKLEIRSDTEMNVEGSGK